MSERDEQQKEIRVTDKRMFTATGELREEFHDLGESAQEPAAANEPAEAASEGAAERPTSAASSAERPVTEGTPIELPPTADSMGQPSFLDLLATLAEPVAIYLGDVELPDGKSAEDLRLARFYIDLLAVLREKTKGNLSSEEHKILEDLLYRLQMRYVQKRS